MLIARDRGAVAEWVFEGGPIEHLTWPTLESSLTCCDNALRALRVHSLLIPTKLEFSQWMRTEKKRVADGSRIDRRIHSVPVDPISPLSQSIPDLRGIVEDSLAFPLTVDILGHGTIFHAQGPIEADNIVWIRATNLEIFRISVMTQSDAWLPFTLAGESQTDVFDLNAQRLVQALEDVKRNTGFELEENHESQFVVVDGFRVDNIRYADGSVADVM